MKIISKIIWCIKLAIEINNALVYLKKATTKRKVYFNALNFIGLCVCTRKLVFQMSIDKKKL